MALTLGEGLQVAGRALESIGAKLEDEVSPGELTTGEWLGLVQEVIADLVTEFADNDSPKVVDTAE